MLMKEIKDDRLRGKDIPYSWLGKIYCQNDYINQDRL